MELSGRESAETLQMSPLFTAMQTGANGWADLSGSHLNCANEVEKSLTERALWFGFVLFCIFLKD